MLLSIVVVEFKFVQITSHYLNEINVLALSVVVGLLYSFIFSKTEGVKSFCEHIHETTIS